MAERQHDSPIDPSVTLEADPEAANALDAAFAASSGEDEVQTLPADDQKPAADAPAAEDGQKPDDQPASDDGGLPAEEQKPAADEPAPESRVLTDATPVDDEDPIIKALNAVKLRADASQKTKDTFNNLKQLSSEGLKAAKTEIARLKAEQTKAIEDARKAAAEDAAKAGALPDDVKQELEDLRRLRARVDVENDPKFKEQFDAKQTENLEVIYGELAKFGLKESELKVLRSLNEADKIGNITELAAKLPPAAKLKIEAKLFDFFNISDAKEKALKDAREQAQKFHVEKEQRSKAFVEEHTRVVQEAVSKFKGESLFKKAEIPATTPPEEKKRLEAQNAFVDKLDKIFLETVQDEDPTAKVEAAYGLVLAHKFKADLDTANTKLAAVQKELDGIKKRSGIAEKGRLVNAPADKSGSRPAATELDAGSSLDELARQLGAQ
jgi:hypothetical protein